MRRARAVRFMDCPAILAEVRTSNQKVQELASEEGLKTAQNVAGVAGFVIPVLWFGMDWQGTASKEVAALQSRQQYLATLVEQRNCGAPAPPPPPSKSPKEQRSKPKADPAGSSS